MSALVTPSGRSKYRVWISKCGQVEGSGNARKKLKDGSGGELENEAGGETDDEYKAIVAALKANESSKEDETEE